MWGEVLRLNGRIKGISNMIDMVRSEYKKADRGKSLEAGEKLL